MILSHYIKHNATSRVPRRFLFFDTEAKQHFDGEAKVQTFRLAVSAFDRSDTDDHHAIATQWETHRTPEHLANYIVGKTRRRSRLIVVAHKLGYDMRIAKTFELLPGLGYDVHRVSMHDRSVSATFRHGDRTICFVDSLGWLPLSIERLGQLIATEKVQLPAFDAADDEWVKRCTTDVQILREAFTDLVDWIEASDLGNWQKTGAAQAWSTWRHKFYTHRVLVHSEEQAQEAETASIYTGRCEAWRHGQLDGGPWAEYDLPLAYPRIALDVNVPVKLVARKAAPSIEWIQKHATRHRILVRANVSTEAPTLPVRDDGRILWPVGEFSGWWWDTELQTAIEYGADVRPELAYSYVARPALAAWAEWVITALTQNPDNLSAVQLVALKHQARALIGRFATRHTVWEPNGPAIEPGVSQHGIFNVDTNQEGKVLTLGDLSWVGYSTEYGIDACPSIMATVMSEARSRLWHLMNVAGLQHVVYVDTDSVIVDPRGAQRLETAIAEWGAWGLRVKQMHPHLKIMGPRQLVTAWGQRIAGVPSKAQRGDGDVWVGEKWEGITAALQRGNADRVIIRPARWRPKGLDRRRGHVEGGHTEAVRISQAQIPGEAPRITPKPLDPHLAPMGSLTA